MKNQERNRLLRTYGKFYTKHYYDRPPEIGGDCYYCGEFAGTIEHVPPISLIENHPIKEWKERGFDIITVRCCSDCNGKLGNKAYLTVETRLNFLEKKLMKEYEKALSMWSEDELSELSEQFRKQVVAKQKQKFMLLERIRNIQWRQQQLNREFPDKYE